MTNYNSTNADTNNESKLNAKSSSKTKGPFLTDIVWPNAIGISLFLVLGFYLFFTFPWIQHYKTAVFGIFYGYLGNFGITVGAHRHFCHNAFKAKPPLKILLLILFTMCGQYPLYNWVRDHRSHHKSSETLADPINAKRGFFFSHVGWLMLKKHPETIKSQKEVDMSDIVSDPYVRFFDRYYFLFVTIFAIVIPLYLPIYAWNETFDYSLKMTIIRYFLIQNITFSVNSFAHLFGKQTYNKNVFSKENIIVSILTNGEGYHNYHHTFPWDYKASERGKFNTSSYLIEIFEKLGLAYDLKETSPNHLKKIVELYGDPNIYAN